MKKEWQGGGVCVDIKQEREIKKERKKEEEEEEEKEE
jgi:hypothetical protein